MHPDTLRDSRRGDQAATKSTGSARLGGARADFVAGLGRKVADLRNAFGRVKGEPASLERREELRRKLHALATAAKLMKCDAMDRAICDAIGVIDRTAIDEPLVDVDLDTIEQTIEDLPALAWGDGPARSSRVEVAAKKEAASATPAYSVLVVGTHHIAEALLEQPDGERPTFACECTPDAQAAFDLVKDKEPDLVVLDADVEASAELVEALMDDAATESIPIVVVGSFTEQGESAKFVALGVTKTVAKPTSREALRAVCEEALAPGSSARDGRVGIVELGEPTLEELGDRLASEIRDALVGRANIDARGRRIPLGEGTEVLGAVWGAIARVREVVTARLDGQVRFEGGPEGALAIAPSLIESEVARSDRARARMRTPAAEVRLTGRRIVVADDDPAVVWFMADLLKTAGCVVHEAFDGKEALELCYRTSPDLVISDILMPSLDGFSLCRALRRDVGLRDTPVILLSWKEDLLQRVRELGAGAAGYVRKESDTRAIVARVREALRPRARVEMRLKEDGDVRGRLDTVSVRTLLEVVCATRPEARVSVRDASFLYEVEIRDGAPQRATRSSGDGTFMKGSRVLAAMLGIGAGRFTVATSKSPIEPDLDGNLAAQLAKPLARARAATALLTGSDMTRVTRVHLDESALAAYLEATPDPARKVARRLADGMAPRSLVVDGVCDATLVDDILCDLAARGLVTAIEANGGQDLLGPAMRALLAHSDTRASLAPRSTTTTPPPAVDEASCAEDGAPLCESPAPDALVHELADRSPEPPGEEVAALAEATIVDDTKYEPFDDEEPAAEAQPADAVEEGEESLEAEEESVRAEPSMSIPIDEASAAVPEAKSAEDQTPEPAVTGADDAAPGVPKRKAWPMVAFVAASGIVAWAVMHFSGGEPAQKRVEVAPPPVMEDPRNVIPPPPPAEPKIEESAYTPAADEKQLPEGHGVLEVAAPPDAVVVVDGTERSRGTAKLPIASGSHDVRVRTNGPSPDERGCTVDVRERRLARVKF